MIVLALLLLVAVAALVLFFVVAGSETVRMEWEELNLAWEPSALVVFLLGVLATLVVVLAIALVRAGTRHRAHQRRELKRLKGAERERSRREHEHAEADRDARAHGDVPSGQRATPATGPAGQGSGARPVAPQDPGPGSQGREGDGSWYDEPRRQD